MAGRRTDWEAEGKAGTGGRAEKGEVETAEKRKGKQGQAGGQRKAGTETGGDERRTRMRGGQGRGGIVRNGDCGRGRRIVTLWERRLWRIKGTDKRGR